MDVVVYFTTWMKLYIHVGHLFLQSVQSWKTLS